MKIFLDGDFKCHTTNPYGTFREVETDSFDGKCAECIKGYRFVPAGESWTREDGMVFTVKMIVPWKPLAELDAAQRQYERELAEAARILLGEVVT